MTDILFTAWNRRRFTETAFEALLANTSWASVERLFVHDDGSEDGTAEWLAENIGRAPVEHVFHGERLGGPVAAMNWYLDEIWPGFGAFVKIDNDVVVCPGWLDELLVVASQNLPVDVFGIAPPDGASASLPAQRNLESARHIGGVGLIRHRIFEKCRPVATGRFGWGAFQEHHPAIVRGWVRPGLPVFELDRLPFDPWQSLVDEYEAAGWQRRWSPYPSDCDYWAWWREEVSA